MRRGRELGNDKWVNAEELEEGATVFNCAKYLGWEEGQRFGNKIHRFHEDAEGQTYRIAAGDLNRLLKEVPEGTYVELQYLGQKEVPQGKFEGKQYHAYKMWELEGEDEPVEDEVAEELPEDPKPAKKKKAAKKATKKAPSKRKAEVEDELDELDELA